MKKLVVLALAVALATVMATAIPSTAKTTVRVDDDVFKPGTVTVSRGTSVTWRWVGSEPHNVTVKRGPVKFHSGTKRSGHYTKRLRRGGTYKIVCTIHSGMGMTLKVR